MFLNRLAVGMKLQTDPPASIAPLYTRTNLTRETVEILRVGTVHT